MRYLVALVLLVGLVGCQEKGPTAVEKATVYMAAKEELERLEKMQKELEESHRKLVVMDVPISKQEMDEYKKACENIETMINDAKKVMAENNPTIR